MPATAKSRRFFAFILIVLALPLYAYDLSEVRTEKLQNGLTVMILEDHTQPLVSTQVLYKVGSRNECVGATGLAHFVEHMAFRATKNFPDTQNAIYGIGGEWHGYTYLDQTTYFETVPADALDLALQLQADRMNNVVNRKEEVEAERGAVLTELRSYENDPATVLFEQTIAQSFMQHPYRFNTIGWTSDVERITHQDLVHFYERYYNPSNAVVAVAGDIRADDVLQKVRKYFGPIPSGVSDSMPRTEEPLQTGERRIVLKGQAVYNYYQITYRAPSASDPDYPAFLLLQGVLGGANGVNFRQSGFNQNVKPGTRLHGAARRINTFFMATADPYVFNIAGYTDPGVPTDQVEAEIEKRVASVREKGIRDEELERVRTEFLNELVFDIETTEDAAHQMAFFEGVNAFEALQKLSDLVKQVRAADIREVAQKYLAAERRTIGWYLPVNASKTGAVIERRQFAPAKNGPQVAGVVPGTPPQIKRLKNGIHVIAQKVDRIPAAYLRVLIPANNIEADAAFTQNDPVWSYTSLNWQFLSEELDQTLVSVRKTLETGVRQSTVDPASLEDPEFRALKTLEEMIGFEPSNAVHPAVVSLVGDVDAKDALEQIQRSLQSIEGAQKTTAGTARPSSEKEKVVRLPGKAQSHFGYALRAPAPSARESNAYRLLLYVLTHGYGGRLGKRLISDTGLVYYISSAYNSDGRNAWISMSFGVNPDQLATARKEFEQIVRDLPRNLPTRAEIDEAKQHLIGRRITAHQSNEEISGYYAKEFIEHGRLLTPAEYAARVNGITLQQLHAIIPAFLDGFTVVVDTNP